MGTKQDLSKWAGADWSKSDSQLSIESGKSRHTIKQIRIALGVPLSRFPVGNPLAGGAAHRPTYGSFKAMRKRCNDPKQRRYADYGGRGIKVCERWASFENFLADMGQRPEGSTLDRINNNGNYEPGNCRWSTPKEQCANRRASAKSHYLELDGKRLRICDWAKLAGLHPNTILQRIRRGKRRGSDILAPTTHKF